MSNTGGATKPEKYGYPEGTRVKITGPSMRQFAEDPEGLLGQEGEVRINSHHRDDPSNWYSWVTVEGVEREYPGGHSLPFAGWFPKESIEEA